MSAVFSQAVAAFLKTFKRCASYAESKRCSRSDYHLLKVYGLLPQDATDIITSALDPLQQDPKLSIRVGEVVNHTLHHRTLGFSKRPHSQLAAVAWIEASVTANRVNIVVLSAPDADTLDVHRNRVIDDIGITYPY